MTLNGSYVWNDSSFCQNFSPSADPLADDDSRSRASRPPNAVNPHQIMTYYHHAFLLCLHNLRLHIFFLDFSFHSFETGGNKPFVRVCLGLKSGERPLFSGGE